MEVCVTFADTDDRDFVTSRAVNLGNLVQEDGRPQAGIRLDIPGFLLPTFRDLNVRKSHGKKTKTHIKFDDSKHSLVLELKLPSSENWLRISPDKARELTVESTAAELRKLQDELRERGRKTDDSSWTSSVNSIPLGSRLEGWRPPSRDGYPFTQFGGER